MNTISGKGRIGLFALFTMLLMPLLGVGTASAFEVGEKVNVLVPDMDEFPAAPEEHQFTCRAITDHAVWLVQDTCAVNDKGSLGDTSYVPKIVWGDNIPDNIVTPASFEQMTQDFESQVWSDVTGICGVPDDINGDGKVVVILAAMATEYSSSNSATTARNDMYYVGPEFFEIDGVEMETMYINIHPYTRVESTIPAAEELRVWNTANALAYLSILSHDLEESAWFMRGIGEYCQHHVFGFTSSDPGEHGHAEALDQFKLQPYIELINITAGNPKYAFASSRGQGFLWFMYLAQRQGEDFISTIAQDTELTSMESIAAAIDPAHDAETAVNDLVVPIYKDWLVCNLHNDFRSDFAGGIYMYDFLAGVEDYENWCHAYADAGIAMKIDEYPMPGEVSEETGPRLMNASMWSMQYLKFFEYPAGTPAVYFNGQYSDGIGARNAVNGRWEMRVVYSNDATGEFSGVEDIELNDLYNGSFNLQNANTWVILTPNNPGGAINTRWYVSQDTQVPAVETAIHQNSIMTQTVTMYSALYDAQAGEMEGYDWIGPILEATLADSTANFKMSNLYGTLWSGLFSAWDSGTYELSFSGYDSTGLYTEAVRQMAVGFADTDLYLEIDGIALDVPRGGAPAGAMVTLAETDAMGLTVQSGLSIADARESITGIVAGPVAIPQVNGTISFESSTNQVSVYHYDGQNWQKLDSWMQNGKVYATVDQGGIYALGEGIGVFAPEIPAQLVLSENAPNPFSAQTAISFGLPTAGRVSVNVFDMTGRLVSTLANEEMAAANHTLVWDGTDVSGNTVGAGVYFCRLETSGQVLTQKMLKVQ